MKLVNLKLLFLMAAACFIWSCSYSSDPKGKPAKVSGTETMDERAFKSVTASFYGHELAGNLTANGETFNPEGLTAAHRSLPFGTKLKLVNPKNGKEVVVRINDRGPFVDDRDIDLSYGAAKKLGILDQGVVRLKYIEL